MANDPLPLAGIKVLDIGTWLAGPAAATILGDFGAEVIKVEPPGTGEFYRYLNVAGALPQCEDSYSWILTNRNKKGLAIDIKQPAGYQALLEMVKQADVLVTNFRPGLLAKMKLRYEDLKPNNERLVFAHLTGYGKQGEEIDTPAFDRTSWWARSGLMEQVRAEGTTPRNCPVGMGDNAAAATLFGAIMLALYQRERTGLGAEVHTSLTGSGAWSNALTLQSALCGAAPVRQDHNPDQVTHLFNQPYQTADDRWFSFFAMDEAAVFEKVIKVIRAQGVEEDPRFADRALVDANVRQQFSLISEAVRRKTWAQWQPVLAEAGVHYVLAQTAAESIEDPQLMINGVFPELHDHRCRATRTVDSPVEITGVTKAKAGHAPGVGEHSVQVLNEYGFSQAEIDRLIALGVVAQMQ